MQILKVVNSVETNLMKTFKKSQTFRIFILFYNPNFEPSVRSNIKNRTIKFKKALVKLYQEVDILYTFTMYFFLFSGLFTRVDLQ